MNDRTAPERTATCTVDVQPTGVIAKVTLADGSVVKLSNLPVDTNTARHVLENVVHLDAAARVAVVDALRQLAGKADRPQRAARSKKEVCDGQP